MRKRGGLDQIFQLAVSPSVPVTFSLNARQIGLAVSLQVFFILKVVVDSLFQVVEYEQPIFLAHGLSDFFEARSTENFDHLNVPDPDDIGDTFCEGCQIV